MIVGGPCYVHRDPGEPRLRPTTSTLSCLPVRYGAESPLLHHLDCRGNALIECIRRDGHRFGPDNGQHPRRRDFKVVPSLHIDHADHAPEVVAEPFDALANIEFQVPYGTVRGGDADLESAC